MFKQNGHVLLLFMIVVLAIVVILGAFAINDARDLTSRCLAGDKAACQEEQARYGWLGTGPATPTPVGAACPECQGWHP